VALPIVAMSNRTSYVISRQGKIVLAFSNLDFQEHVSRSMAAVKTLAAAK
jgi:peroxiredoxin Q/BCP